VTTVLALVGISQPATLLIGTAIAMALPAGRAGMGNPGAHGLSEVRYAMTSAANSNGSAFGGLMSNTGFYNTLLAIIMLLGRYLPALALGPLAEALH